MAMNPSVTHRNMLYAFTSSRKIQLINIRLTANKALNVALTLTDVYHNIHHTLHSLPICCHKNNSPDATQSEKNPTARVWESHLSRTSRLPGSLSFNLSVGFSLFVTFRSLVSRRPPLGSLRFAVTTRQHWWPAACCRSSRRWTHWGVTTRAGCGSWRRVSWRSSCGCLRISCILSSGKYEYCCVKLAEITCKNIKKTFERIKFMIYYIHPKSGSIHKQVNAAECGAHGCHT